MGQDHSKSKEEKVQQRHVKGDATTSSNREAAHVDSRIDEAFRRLAAGDAYIHYKRLVVSFRIYSSFLANYSSGVVRRRFSGEPVEALHRRQATPRGHDARRVRSPRIASGGHFDGHLRADVSVFFGAPHQDLLGCSWRRCSRRRRAVHCCSG